MVNGAIRGNPSFSHLVIFRQGLRDSYDLKNILQPKHAPQNILVAFIKSQVFAFCPGWHGSAD